MEDIIEDKQGTQTGTGTPLEKAAGEGDVQPQPSYEELKSEVDRKEKEILKLQGITKDLQKRGGMSKEEAVALHGRLGGLEESHADLRDYLAGHFGDTEETQLAKKTHRQQLDEKRGQDKSAPASADAEVQRFVDYVDDQGLSRSDPLVEEAMEEYRTPSEALKYLKEKVVTKNQADVEKRAEELANRKSEQTLKDKGYTSTGVESPSAPSKDVSSMTPDEKLAEGFKQLKSKK